MDQIPATIEFSTGPAIGLLGVLVTGIVLLFLVFGVARFVSNFLKELRYLNSEIARTDGEERKHYIRCKRRLLRSLIPFIRR